MQFSVKKNDLLPQLQKVAKAVSTRTSNPILTHILFELDNSLLTIRATDLEITMSSQITVNGIESGDVAVPARLFLDIINEVDEEEILFKSDKDNGITIKTSRGEFEIMGKPGEEFPGIPDVSNFDELTIEKKTLLRLIQKVIIAVSKDELKAALTGVYFQIKSNELRTVATDGHRLVCLKRKDFVSNGIEKNIIIPIKFLNLVSTYLNEEGTIVFYISENHAKINVDTITIYTRLIDERFPDYESVIPYNNDKILKVKVADLIPALRRAAIIANKISHQVSLDIKSGEMNIKAIDYEMRNSAKETLQVEYVGDNITIGFNVEYLKEILRNIDTEYVVVTMKTPISASLIEPEVQTENEEMLSLLMPVRLTD